LLYVYKFSGGAWSTVLSWNRGVWNADASLAPGEGCFVQLAPGSSPTNVTCVGTVLQGSLSNQFITTGFSVVSSKIPVSNTIDSTGNGGLGYVPVNGDHVYAWDPVAQGYLTYSFSRNVWNVDPVLSPGQAVFLDTTNPAPSWNQNFTVQ